MQSVPVGIRFEDTSPDFLINVLNVLHAQDKLTLNDTYEWVSSLSYVAV